MSDPIDRQSAINTAQVMYERCDGNIEDYRDLMVESLKVLPSAQQWIPCSERLPEKPNMYTVTDSKGDVVRFVFYDNESSREYWRRCAKAWMPLPEPYKGD